MRGGLDDSTQPWIGRAIDTVLPPELMEIQGRYYSWKPAPRPYTGGSLRKREILPVKVPPSWFAPAVPRCARSFHLNQLALLAESVVG